MTLEQRIREALTKQQRSYVCACECDVLCIDCHSPIFARALEAGLVDLCGKSDGVEFDLTSAEDAFIAALSEDI